MKEIIQTRAELKQRMHNFSQRIHKRSQYFHKFKKVIENDFASIIQEDINICVCCKTPFKGKSIGPHYKNSRRCAEFKESLKRQRRPLRESQHTINNEPQNQPEELRTIENHVNYNVFESSEENISVNLEEVDDFFYSQ